MKYLPVILILGIALIVLIVQCIRWNREDDPVEVFVNMEN